MQCGINVIPYLIVFKAGEPIVRHPGPADDEELADMLGQ
jgi:thioredoxin-like negative regulator of GroEL